MKAVIVDIDGVVLHDDTALPGARELVEWLVGSGLPFLFLTNYPSMTPADLHAAVPRRGAPRARTGTSTPRPWPPPSSCTTRPATAARVYVVGEGALVDALCAAGFNADRGGERGLRRAGRDDVVQLRHDPARGLADPVRGPLRGHQPRRGRAPGAGRAAARWPRPSSGSRASARSTWASPARS